MAELATREMPLEIACDDVTRALATLSGRADVALLSGAVPIASR